MAYDYAPSYSTGSVTPESAQKTGLGTGQNILSNRLRTKNQYPSDISGSLQAPATGQMAANQAYAPMAQIGGLMGGDYDKLQTSLQQPIMDYDKQQQQNIAQTYGGKGLYGSVGGGLMSGAQAAQGQSTQNALSNAVAQRYALQLEDMGQQMDENKSLFAAGASSADQLNQYNQQKLAWDVAQEQQGIDFANAMQQMQQQYGIDSQNWATAQDELNFQRAMQLAGQGSSGATAAAMIGANDAAETAALYSGIGQVAGGLLGSYGDDGWTFGGISDEISSWF